MRVLITILVLVVVSLLFVIDPRQSQHRLFIEVWNLGHFLVFFSGTYWWLLHSDRSSKPTSLTLICVVGCALAVLTEVIQLTTPHRSFSFTDIIKDITGIGAAILMFLFVTNKRRRFGVASIAITLLVFSRLLYLLMDEAVMRAQAPTLSDFESVSELSRWTGANLKRDSKFSAQGEHSLFVKINQQAKYSGATLKHLIKDWSDYSRLQLSVWSDADTALTLRVHDFAHEHQYHDRFNRLINLEQGWNTITISLEDIRNAPKQRPMDMTQIVNLGIFSSRPHQAKTIRLDAIELLN